MSELLTLEKNSTALVNLVLAFSSGIVPAKSLFEKVVESFHSKSFLFPFHFPGHQR